MAADPQAHQRWKEEKKRLLQRIHASGSPAYCQAAAVQLAALAIEDGQLERAARLLDELPPLTTDPTFARVQLHIKQSEPQKALETAQKRLYVLVEQVQNLLMLLQSKEMLPDVQRRFAVWQVQKELMRLFFDHSGMSDACGIDLLLEQGRTEEAAAALAQFVQAMAGPAPCPKAFLFTPGLRPKEGQPVTKEMAALLLRTLPQEEKYAALLQHPACKAALEQLRTFAAQDD